MSGSKIHHQRHEEEEVQEEKAGTKHTHVSALHMEVAQFEDFYKTANIRLLIKS